MVGKTTGGARHEQVKLVVGNRVGAVLGEIQEYFVS